MSNISCDMQLWNFFYYKYFPTFCSLLWKCRQLIFLSFKELVVISDYEIICSTSIFLTYAAYCGSVANIFKYRWNVYVYLMCVIRFQ